MKKLILSAVAATLVMGPMAAAPASAQRTVTTVRHDNHGRTVVTKKTVVRNQQHRNWRKGQRFDRRYAPNYRVIDYRQYRGRLRQPPRGYHWVRSGNDAVLVGITSGIISAVIANAIR